MKIISERSVKPAGGTARGRATLAFPCKTSTFVDQHTIWLAMAKHHAALIVPKDFPELGMLVWNRDNARPIEREEAFELYERNWRHVDAEHLTPAEAQLIEALTQEFGQGHLLVA